MPEPHFLLEDRGEDREFRRRGGGDKHIREVERRTHGAALVREFEAAVEEFQQEAPAEGLLVDELRALGVILVLEGAEAEFPLKLDSLERVSRHAMPRPKWMLLTVSPAGEETPEQAVVWISDAYLTAFLGLFQAYIAKNWGDTQTPVNNELVANTARIRQVVLRDFWQSDGEPPTSTRTWWEIWLRPTDDALDLFHLYATQLDLRTSDRALRLVDRTVAWIEATWDQLGAMPFSSVPVSEIRRPEFVDVIGDLPYDDQQELAADLAGRVRTADQGAPAVCHLDTAIRRSHVLLDPSLHIDDVHSVFGVTNRLEDRVHGTLMAGLALYGNIETLLLGTSPVVLEHRLESVKILPDVGANDPLAYGVVTADAVALPETMAPARRRTFCMPITAHPDKPGEPSLWSASVDALAVGAGVARATDGITVLGGPDTAAARLFVISAGNVPVCDFQQDYRSACDASAIEDPAHAWNALTVGAHTEMNRTPSGPGFDGWTPLASSGDISPHSRTSLLFDQHRWPVKPDICMEGGNVLTDGANFDEAHPIVSLQSTDARDDTAIGSVNATSAATAQAARLAAKAQARYPTYWPESVRGLLVHAAEWTPAMRAELDAVPSKKGKRRLLRRYGWGVPNEDRVLASTEQAVTLVIQDSFVPFDGRDYRSRRFRLHELPWPSEQLRALDTADVTLRVTLSYFIEPAAGRRGWRQRYTYPSHGLRFELKLPTETQDEFVARVNREAAAEEAGGQSSGDSQRWLIGPNQRNLGSLHQDIWEGSAVELAAAGTIAVHPVGGWWKNNRRKDRMNAQVRYALIVSLKTLELDVDLYAPIAALIGVPTPIIVPGT